MATILRYYDRGASTSPNWRGPAHALSARQAQLEKKSAVAAFPVERVFRALRISSWNHSKAEEQSGGQWLHGWLLYPGDFSRPVQKAACEMDIGTIFHTTSMKGVMKGDHLAAIRLNFNSGAPYQRIWEAWLALWRRKLGPRPGFDGWP